MRNSVWAVWLVLAVVIPSGCSLGSVGRSGSRKEADSEVVALKARIVELQRRAVLAEVELARVQRRLAEFESAASGRQEEASVAPRPAPAGIENLPSAGSSGVEVTDLPADPGSEPVVPGTGGSSPEVPNGQDEGKTADSVVSSGELTVAAQALYDRGYTLFHRARYVDSETAFQKFLQSYSGTVLGDNAQFWIAEARYARGDVSGALAAYRETATRFPDGNKAPDAVLKSGDCLRDLGDQEAARRSYRAVLRDFPSSAAAAAAEERLAGSE